MFPINCLSLYEEGYSLRSLVWEGWQGILRERGPHAPRAMLGIVREQEQGPIRDYAQPLRPPTTSSGCDKSAPNPDEVPGVARRRTLSYPEDVGARPLGTRRSPAGIGCQLCPISGPRTTPLPWRDQASPHHCLHHLQLMQCHHHVSACCMAHGMYPARPAPRTQDHYLTSVQCAGAASHARDRGARPPRPWESLGPIINPMASLSTSKNISGKITGTG